MRNAASVGTIPEPERTRSGSPARSRSRLSDADTCGWCMPSRTAARETLRSVNTVCKTLIKWRSILSKSARSLIPIPALLSYGNAYAMPASLALPLLQT